MLWQACKGAALRYALFAAAKRLARGKRKRYGNRSAESTPPSAYLRTFPTGQTLTGLLITT
jgi:hypothetical protein